MTVVRLADHRRKIDEESWAVPAPHCALCGRSTRLVAILDQPIYGDATARLAEFVCDRCGEHVEEVVAVPERYDPPESKR